MIINALEDCNNNISHDSHCEDSIVMAHALKSSNNEIDIKDSGTAMRFLTAYFSTQPGERIITGSERMQQRPIGILVDALRQVGADIEYLGNEGYPPLRIRGKYLDGGKITMQGDVSSQYISAILMVAPYMTKGLHLTITGNILSKPYIDMTVAMMRFCGADVEYKRNKIKVYISPYLRRYCKIDRDWSAASYWYEIASLSGKEYILNNCPYITSLEPEQLIAASEELSRLGNNIDVDTKENIDCETEEGRAFCQEKISVLNNITDLLKQINSDWRTILAHLEDMGKNHIQGDEKIADYYTSLGLNTTYSLTEITLSHVDNCRPKSLKLNLSDTPDLAPTLIVGCLLKNQPFRIDGLDNLRIKECDRIEALQSEALKLGYILTQPKEGCLEWKGKKCDVQHPIVIDTHNDHRIAMAFAPAALVFDEIYIDNPQVVNKSYPNYWNDLQEAGFVIEPVDDTK